MTTSTLIALIIAIVAAAIAVVIWVQRAKTHRLKVKFGPEYDRLAQNEGRGRAEAILESRQKRVEKFDLRHLSHEECQRFAEEWRATQQRFVDDPRRAVAQADQLVNEALRARGYPMSDFEQQAADISVEHPRVVEDYRTAHDVAIRETRGQATTDDLRLAMQHYRNLFEHVLDETVMHHEELRRQ